MKVNYKQLTLLEEINQAINKSGGDSVVDYIELNEQEMAEFLDTMKETGLEHSTIRGFDETYYVYRGVRIYEERV